MTHRILLIISGGIAAYKSLDLIRRLRERSIAVRTILTKGGAQFVTPLSVSGLSGEKVYCDLFSLTDEQEMGHIRLVRECDLIVICPASADLLAKMAHGLADDLASTALLAADKPVLVAPAMNTMMWQHPATQANIETLRQRGVSFIDPASGALACGEVGAGRLAEVDDILTAITTHLAMPDSPLQGQHILVTAGPTHEPVDPIRYLGNRSSGKQGYAIATELARRGAQVTLVSGPVSLAPPDGVNVVRVETAAEMLAAVKSSLPATAAICTAAVADWKADQVAHKLKKQAGQTRMQLALEQTPDILQFLGNSPQRPAVLIGFAAETEDVVDNARAKLNNKNCDAIVANGVGVDNNNPFGADENTVHLVTAAEVDDWPRMTKQDVAKRLCDWLATQVAIVNTQPQSKGKIA